MTKADKVRALLATEPARTTHEQIAAQCGCSRRWVSAIARAMRPPPAETDIEARLRALEQWRKDVTEHLKRREKRPIATLNYRPSPRLSLRVHLNHGKTSDDLSLKRTVFPEYSCMAKDVPMPGPREIGAHRRAPATS